MVNMLYDLLQTQVLLFLLIFSQTDAQRIPTYQLCQQQDVRVETDTYGFIELEDTNTAGSCTLTISGLRSYVTLLGIAGDPVPGCTGLVYVNDQEHCINQTAFPLVIDIGVAVLNITIPVNSSPFSVEYQDNGKLKF